MPFSILKYTGKFRVSEVFLFIRNVRFLLIFTEIEFIKFRKFLETQKWVAEKIPYFAEFFPITEYFQNFCGIFLLFFRIFLEFIKAHFIKQILKIYI